MNDRIAMNIKLTRKSTDKLFDRFLFYSLFFFCLFFSFFFKLIWRRCSKPVEKFSFQKCWFYGKFWKNKSKREEGINYPCLNNSNYCLEINIGWKWIIDRFLRYFVILCSFYLFIFFSFFTLHAIRLCA